MQMHHFFWIGLIFWVCFGFYTGFTDRGIITSIVITVSGIFATYHAFGIYLHVTGQHASSEPRIANKILRSYLVVFVGSCIFLLIALAQAGYL